MTDATPSPGEQGASRDPLHGRTLEQIVTELQEKLGWDGLAAEVRINCFMKDPSVKSSLKFLRRTPWARTQVEQLYVRLSRGGKASRPSQSRRPPAKAGRGPGTDPWSSHRKGDA